MKGEVGSPQYQLAVVVINFRTPELTINCLKSLDPELKGLNACVVLVDNNSADESIDKIEQYIKELGIKHKIFVHRSSVNGGFSAGNNLGIKAVEASYYLLANSDTLIRKGALHTLLNAAKQNDKIGLLAPRLEWLDGIPQESCFKYHSPWSECISSAKTSYVTKLLKNYVVPQPVSEVADDYDWVSFACVLIKAEVFKEIGLMDEGYFMYFEDVAFCYRAKESGWLIRNEPSAHVVHLRGGSSPLKAQAKLRKRLPRYFYESRTRYFFQIYGRKGLLLANLLWSLGWLVSCSRSLLSKSFVKDVSENQWQDIWINFAVPEKTYIHPDKYVNKR
jgi:N-acetylglucosaminyl-diphospho-decaprenol L-rhamnosyltransferase